MLETCQQVREGSELGQLGHWWEWDVGVRMCGKREGRIREGWVDGGRQMHTAEIRRG